MGIAVAEGENVYVASRADNSEDNFNAFLRFVFGRDVKKTVHNKKDLRCELRSEKLAIENVVFDTALAAYVLDATRKRYDLVSVSHTYGVELDVPCDKLSDPANFSPLMGSEEGLCALATAAETLCFIE